MKLHRYILRPTAPWGTPLRSDTLYGILLYRLAERQGAAACREAIAAFAAGNPPFVLSSVLPQDRVPMPRLAPLSRGAFRRLTQSDALCDGKGNPLNIQQALQKYKDFRKQPTLPLADWQRHAPRLSVAALFTEYCRNADNSKKHYQGYYCPRCAQQRVHTKLQRAEEPHVTLSRTSGTAQQGGLFSTWLTYFAPDTRMHLYARTNSADTLLTQLQEVGELGFGKDASTGKGSFSVEIDPAFDPAPLDVTGNHALLLSVCAATDMRALEGTYSVEVKRGKVGPAMGSPYKNPLLLVQEGSVLRSLPQGPFVLEGIHPCAEVKHIVQPLTVACTLAEEEAEHGL